MRQLTKYNKAIMLELHSKTPTLATLQALTNKYTTRSTSLVFGYFVSTHELFYHFTYKHEEVTEIVGDNSGSLIVVSDELATQIERCWDKVGLRFSAYISKNYTYTGQLELF